jgi:hypothetical protein
MSQKSPRREHVQAWLCHHRAQVLRSFWPEESSFSRPREFSSTCKNAVGTATRENGTRGVNISLKQKQRR